MFLAPLRLWLQTYARIREGLVGLGNASLVLRDGFLSKKDQKHQ